MRPFSLWPIGGLCAAGAFRRRDPQPAQPGSEDAAGGGAAAARIAAIPKRSIPIAALVNDPVDEIQLEAIAAELSFFLVEDVPRKNACRVRSSNVRNPGRAAAAFELGPLAVWPRPVPPELVDGLLKAIDDENPKVRIEAIYALGTIARPPLAADGRRISGQGARSLRSGRSGRRRRV